MFSRAASLAAKSFARKPAAALACTAGVAGFATFAAPKAQCDNEAGYAAATVCGAALGGAAAWFVQQGKIDEVRV